MIKAFTSLAVLAGLTLAAAQTQPTCSGTAYDPNAYVCAGGYLCSTGTPCKCISSFGADLGCYSTAAYHCTSNNGFTELDQGPGDNSRGVCGASTKGDPLVRGFDGCAWYLKGEPDTVMNLVSEANHVVNTWLVPANLTDEHHVGGGTFHGAISMRYQDTLVTARATPEGTLSVALDDTAVPFESIRAKSGMTVRVSEHYNYFGQVAEIVTPAFRFFIHAVQPYDSAAGWSRGHLDFSATVTAADVTMHGLLGQSFHGVGSLCSNDFNFHGLGNEMDYKMAALDSVDFVYSLFASQKTTRRLQTLPPKYMAASSTRTARLVGRS